MSKQDHIKAAIDRAYQLQSLLAVAEEAVIEDRGQFANAGGATVLGMAADMAGEIVMGLERGEEATPAGASAISDIGHLAAERNATRSDEIPQTGGE